mgnify:CR=1 FL=1
MPERLLPVTVPTLATLDGVIAPRVSEMAGAVVAFATVPLTPFAVVTDTDVTVPLPPPPVLAIVTMPSAPVPVVVRVILLPSTSFRLPPVADSVAVWLVASDVFVIV